MLVAGKIFVVTMSLAGFYRRVLPSPPAIDFTSPEGKKMFSEALQAGTTEGFFKLIACFQTQSEPAYCGLASLSNVLNALSVDPGRTWKGPWRWYDESMLDCCEPLEKVKAEGITFAKVACLAACAGASVRSFRANRTSLEEFRHYVAQCASSEDKHIIVSYHRRPLRQTGTGHFSPVGAYHSERDMVLILDVARFKYPPHWLPLPLLWNAIDTIDETTGKTRGFMMVSKGDMPASLLFTLSCKDERWRAMSEYLMERVPQLLQSCDAQSVENVLDIVISSLPSSVSYFVNWIAEVRRGDQQVEDLEKDEAERLIAKSKVLQQLRETEVYDLTMKVLDSRNQVCSLASQFGDDLPEAVTNACCEGAATLSRMFDVSNAVSFDKCCVATIKTRDNMTCTVVSSNVKKDGTEQNIDVLVPTAPEVRGSCGCKQSDATFSENLNYLHPASKDLLAILLLVLPPQIWQEIGNLNVRLEVCNLVSSTGLPNDLHEEVKHLREQLQLVSGCLKDNMDESLEGWF